MRHFSTSSTSSSTRTRSDSRRTIDSWALALGLLLGVPLTAPAQDAWPTRSVRIIAPFGAGGGGDTSLRMLSQYLARALNQSIVVDNKPGASGIIGVQEALKAPADGYTLFYGSTTTLAANSSTLKKIPYDPVADFRSISLVSWIPYMLVVAPDTKATSVAQLIALAKSAPRPLSFASSNDTGLVAGQSFARAAGVQLLNVPYKATPGALTDLIGGQVTLMFVDVASGLPQVKGGKLRALAMTSTARSSLLPEAPIVAETLPGYEIIGWTAMATAAGTPAAVIRRVHAEIEKILGQAEVKTAFEVAGFEPKTATPEATDAFVRAERDKWAQRVKAAGIVPQ